MGLYIFPGARTLLYQQGNHNSCILLSLASALHYMGDGYALEYIIRGKQKSILSIQNKDRMHFCRGEGNPATLQGVRMWLWGEMRILQP